MKSSIKFREERPPILRAKVPINVLGFPFRSGIEAGESKELCLSLSTFLDYGPIFKLCYRPNDALRPFGFVVKTGIGHFGSPISAPMTMSAEFNLLSNGEPSFFLHFKPQFGDFSIKQTVSSQIALPEKKKKKKSAVKDEDGMNLENGKVSENEEETAVGVGGGGSLALSGLFSGGFQEENAVEKLFAGGVSVKTSLPVRDRGLVKLRWSVRFPQSSATASDHPTPVFRKTPFLVLNKIGIEHVASNKKNAEGQSSKLDGDVAVACFAMRREVGQLQVENALLREKLEELRSDIGTGKCFPASELRDSGKSKGAEWYHGKSIGGNRETKENKGKDAEKATTTAA